MAKKSAKRTAKKAPRKPAKSSKKPAAKSGRSSSKTKGQRKQQLPLWVECENILGGAILEIEKLVESRITSGQYKYRADCDDLFDGTFASGLVEFAKDELLKLEQEAGRLVPYLDEEAAKAHK